MIRLSRLKKEWEKVGSLRDYIPIKEFLPDGTFLTKNGAKGIAAKVHGIDSQCREETDLAAITEQFEQAFRVFGPEYRVYQYLIKEKSNWIDTSDLQRAEHLVALGLYSINLFLAVVGPGLEERLESFSSILEGLVKIERLNAAGMYRFLYRLIHLERCQWTPMATQHLDCYLGRKRVAIESDYLEIGKKTAKVLTLKDPPAPNKYIEQDANLPATERALGSLFLGIDGEFIACSQWQAFADGQGVIKRNQLHAHKSKKRATVGSSVTKDILVDASQVNRVWEMGKALTMLDQGHSLGQYSLTIVATEGASKIETAIVQRGGSVYQEHENAFFAWVAMIPGNQTYDHRQFCLMDSNYADLSLVWKHAEGSKKNAHLDKECLTVLRTESKTPYYFNLHSEGSFADTAHSVIVGRTGSGKSFLLNAMVTALQKYSPFTLIFDFGGSFEFLTRRYGGSYVKVSEDKKRFTINPFACEPTKENLKFLTLFVKVLLEIGGAPPLTVEEGTDLYWQIEAMFDLVPEDRRLSHLAVMARLKPRLSQWCQGGQHGWLFDNVEDTVTIADFQCFDWYGMKLEPDAMEPLMLYMLHRADREILGADPRRLKVLVIDEAWKHLGTKQMQKYVSEALRTWRKHNAMVVLSTQSVDELRHSEIVEIILESCMTRIFLANPKMDEELYKLKLKLNAAEIKVVRDLRPKRDMLLVKPEGSSKLSLEVDAKSAWLWRNDPTGNAQRREAIEQYGEQWLEKLVSQ